MPDPRMLIAWLVLIILIVLVIVTPIAVVVAMRARRRAIAKFRTFNVRPDKADELKEFLRTRSAGQRAG